ncbi:hypothetical protein LC087_03235 [Bacillus carboniphilus]|uniref:Uncharacterized protein n=1 Tax=Bacillus carboniphilus TaxID=86663 RepID=A0ABY9JUX9_9BACI|nr:hypothetical protein [Bacillus carboniphilus]WLR43224.1 hypothetical protein LC087_03235 [Bacillus carboniphilus]
MSETSRIMVIDGLMWLFVFLVFLTLGSVLNILLKMTKLHHWIITLFLSFMLAFFTVSVV